MSWSSHKHGTGWGQPGTKKGVGKEFNFPPDFVIASGAFGNQDMDMRIPLETAAKGMKDADKARCELLRAVDFVEHLKDNFFDRLKKEIEKFPVFKKKVADFLRNRKNQVPVSAAYGFQRNRSRALDGIEIPTSGTKTAAAVKRDELDIATGFTFINSATVIRIATMNHAVDIFNNGCSWFEQNHNLLIMLNKNLL